jgi:hypothetical protein
MTLLEWFNTQNYKVGSTNPDFEYIEELRKDSIKWTKKLYDIHRHDRFLALVE